MSVGLVITVRNEERLLRTNILYHLSIGVKKVYVYLDGTTDGTAKTIKGLNGVEVQNSVEAKRYMDKPYLSIFWSQAKEHHTARQCLNTYDALEKCKEESIDWLISLDADELFVTDIKDGIPLNSFFNGEEIKNVDVIYFKTLEVISRQMAYKNVMAEETLFKTKKNFSNKLDQIYFQIKNPYSNKNMRLNYWLGHRMGKAAIKVESKVIPKNVHRYQSYNNQPLKSISKGCLLHYHIYDFNDFQKKYQNFEQHPPVYLSGNKINGLKSLWIKMVNDAQFSESDLRNYFENYLVFNPRKLKRLQKTRFGNLLKRQEAATLEVNLPKNILTNFFRL